MLGSATAASDRSTPDGGALETAAAQLAEKALNAEATSVGLAKAARSAAVTAAAVLKRWATEGLARSMASTASKKLPAWRAREFSVMSRREFDDRRFPATESVAPMRRKIVTAEAFGTERSAAQPDRSCAAKAGLLKKVDAAPPGASVMLKTTWCASGGAPSGVDEADTVLEGVTDAVGVTEVDSDIVGVTDAVTDMVGVMDAVTEIVGVAEGSKHWVMDVAPPLGVVRPAGQVMHAAAPFVETYEPGAQGVQLVAATAENEPRAHIRQEVEPALALKVPAEQRKHSLSDMKLPAEHAAAV